MNSILARIVKTKRTEVELAKQRRSLSDLENAAKSAPPPRNFLAALRGFADMRLIAEVKKASPSKGIIREDFNPVSIATEYELGGAAAISVLTDESYFQGHLDYMSAVRAKVSIPVLRKDFIIDEYQIWEARSAGADAILLIAECLSPNQLKDYFQLAQDLGMSSLIELHAPNNLDAVLDTGTQLIGVNNRDLETFQVDLGHVVRLRANIPKEVTVVGESGITSHKDTVYLKSHGIDAMLVGESLMRKHNVRDAVTELLGKS